jgi:hypothetical protein
VLLAIRRFVDVVTRELVVEQDHVDGGVAVEGMTRNKGILNESVMPQCMPSRLVIDEETQEKTSVEELLLLGVEGMIGREMTSDTQEERTIVALFEGLNCITAIPSHFNQPRSRPGELPYIFTRSIGSFENR